MDYYTLLSLHYYMTRGQPVDCNCVHSFIHAFMCREMIRTYGRGASPRGPCHRARRRRDRTLSRPSSGNSLGTKHPKTEPAKPSLRSIEPCSRFPFPLKRRTIPFIRLTKGSVHAGRKDELAPGISSGWDWGDGYGRVPVGR